MSRGASARVGTKHYKIQASVRISNHVFGTFFYKFHAKFHRFHQILVIFRNFVFRTCSSNAFDFSSISGRPHRFRFQHRFVLDGGRESISGNKTRAHSYAQRSWVVKTEGWRRKEACAVPFSWQAVYWEQWARNGGHVLFSSVHREHTDYLRIWWIRRSGDAI